jgi:ubiquitin carboxyl-terminal hydrolase 25
VYDFSDTLLTFAFDRQRDCDPQNTPYYFDCISEIAAQRKSSEDLILKLTLLKSEGFYSKRDVLDALRHFRFEANINSLQYLDEQHVKGTYMNYIEATAVHTHAESREKLRVIAKAMNSKMLEDVAASEVETYEQALEFLGGDATTPDDTFADVLFTVKTADSPNNTELARKAISVIAEQRNSTYLREWLLSGTATATTIDFEEACRVLQITDRSNIDLENLDIQINSYMLDDPNREAEFRRAADVIKAHLASESPSKPQEPARNPAEWPVGLGNLGATCYLNSLLQFFFTVKPFRDMLLHFDEGFRMENNTENIKLKKVGGRQVTAKEVDRSHECRS